MKIEFHGANKNVTGSCHMVHCNGKQLLIDCGMYQGGREIFEENSPQDPSRSQKDSSIPNILIQP